MQFAESLDNSQSRSSQDCSQRIKVVRREFRFCNGQPESAVSEYVLDDRLGGGTFGEVWKARAGRVADQFVAIKLPNDPQYLRSLQREGVAIHGLVHPNIVRAIGFDPYADPAYLVTEYVPGTSLRPLVQSRNMSVDDVVAVMRQILSGLSTRIKRDWSSRREAREYSYCPRAGRPGRLRLGRRDLKSPISGWAKRSRRRRDQSPTRNRLTRPPVATSRARSITCRPSSGAVRRSTGGRIFTRAS